MEKLNDYEMDSMGDVKQIKNIVILMLLFLVPGILVTLAYILVAKLNLTSLAKLGIAGAIALIPVQLGIILYSSKKKYGFYSIKKMISYNESIDKKYYYMLVPTLIIYMALIFTFGKTLDEFLKNELFSWVPDWFVLSVDYSGLNESQLLVTFLFAFFIVGILLPIVEEIYFRGFLLPRMEWMGKLAPIVNAILFAIYHFWTPWQTVTRIIALIPFCYVSYKFKNIRLTIIVHCLINIVGDAVIVFVLLCS